MSNIKNFELSRETYRQIKSFDRQQMEQFIREIRKDAIATSVDFEALRTKIGEIKGIGASRLDEIMDVIESDLSDF